MKKETLLEIAKKTTRRKNANTPIDNEVIELAVAWAKNEISISQVCAAIGAQNTQTAYNKLLNALKAYVASLKQPKNP